MQVVVAAVNVDVDLSMYLPLIGERVYICETFRPHPS